MCRFVGKFEFHLLFNLLRIRMILWSKIDEDFCKTPPSISILSFHLLKKLPKIPTYTSASSSRARLPAAAVIFLPAAAISMLRCLYCIVCNAAAVIWCECNLQFHNILYFLGPFLYYPSIMASFEEQLSGLAGKIRASTTSEQFDLNNYDEARTKQTLCSAFATPLIGEFNLSPNIEFSL